MYKLGIHPDATEDLRQLWRRSPTAAACLTALIQELQGDETRLDRLTLHGFGQAMDAPFDISKWHQQWNRGKNLWRMKVRGLEVQSLRYRLIYAYIPGKQRYLLLAIAHRNDIDYDDPSNALHQRILHAYSQL